MFCVSDGSGALFLIPFLRNQKKAGTYSTTLGLVFFEEAKGHAQIDIMN